MFSRFSLCVLINAYIYIPAATTTTISSVCGKCGTSAKSGKISCCGRGGSWFGNCGSAELDHTWYEGIQVCKIQTQSKTASGQQSNAAQELKLSGGADMGKFTVITTANAFTSTNTLTPMPGGTPMITTTITAASTSPTSAPSTSSKT